MRIVHLILTRRFAGSERYAIELANAQAEAHEVYLILNREAAGAGPGAFAHRVSPRVRIKWVNGWFKTWQARALVRQLRPDVAHAHLRSACRALHGLRGLCLRVATLHIRYKTNQHAALDALIAIAPWQMADIPPRLREHTQQIDNWTLAQPAPPEAGAQLRAQHGIAPDAWVFGAVGRIEHSKGFDLLLDAFAQSQLPHAWLVIVGQGQDLGALRHRAGPRVLIPGFAERPEEWLAAFDCFVSSARSEPFGLALLEAFAAGLPVLATASQGAQHLQHLIDAPLLPLNNVPALRDAFIALAAQRPGRQSYPLAGLRLQPRLAQFEQFYQRELKHVRPASPLLADNHLAKETRHDPTRDRDPEQRPARTPIDSLSQPARQDAAVEHAPQGVPEPVGAGRGALPVLRHPLSPGARHENQHTDRLNPASPAAAPQARARLSVVVLTFNEARHLPACLESAAFADELLVIDSGSTDQTCDIARQRGARFEVFSQWEGFATQRNRALALCSADYVFFLDADERFTPDLRDEVLAIVARGERGAWRVRWQQVAFGRALTRMASATLVQRLFYRPLLRGFEGVVHEQAMLTTKLPNQRLRGYLLHHSYPSVQVSLRKMTQYAMLGAAKRAELGQRGGVIRGLASAASAFFRMYVIKGGFLEGGPGFLYCYTLAQECFYRYAALRYDHDQLSSRVSR